MPGAERACGLQAISQDDRTYPDLVIRRFCHGRNGAARQRENRRGKPHDFQHLNIVDVEINGHAGDEAGKLAALFHVARQRSDFVELLPVDGFPPSARARSRHPRISSFQS